MAFEIMILIWHTGDWRYVSGSVLPPSELILDIKVRVPHRNQNIRRRRRATTRSIISWMARPCLGTELHCNDAPPHAPDTGSTKHRLLAPARSSTTSYESNHLTRSTFICAWRSRARLSLPNTVPISYQFHWGVPLA
jgi:hypothetical protein